MKKLNICVDIDGTINNYADVVWPLAMADFGVNHDPTNYEVFAGVSSAELAAFHARHEAALIVDVEPLPGAVDALRYLQQVGHSVNLITARPYAMAAGTLSWLRGNGVPYGSILFNCDDKAAACRFIAGDVMVDDAPQNLSTLITAGVPTVVFDQPYNVDFALPRLSSWTAINDVELALTEAVDHGPTTVTRRWRPWTTITATS